VVKKIIIASLVVVLVIFSIYFYTDKSNKFNNSVIVWVWERPENLYFLKDKNVTFAYLSGTVTKTNEDLVYYPRRQPLRIPDDSNTTAVVRIEDRSDDHKFTDEDLVDISDYVAKSCLEKTSNISCQLDFDAVESQIDFYKKLVINVREKLPQNIKLSITALVSWCTNEIPWFNGLPVDEAVPMFFRLGKEENLYWKKIEEGNLKLDVSCQKSIGIATDEPLPHKIYLENKPIYIFNNKYWSPANWAIIKSEILQKLDE
jgi:hypothetical protein